jgi:hypothetical protein
MRMTFKVAPGSGVVSAVGLDVALDLREHVSSEGTEAQIAEIGQELVDALLGIAVGVQLLRRPFEGPGIVARGVNGGPAPLKTLFPDV